jgi:ribosome-binding factor A
MAQEFSRSRRVSEQLKRELAQLIHDEVKDPRVRMVTVNAVEVSRDLAYARVYVTSLVEQDQRDKLIEGLNKAAGFLRRELGRRISLRATPQLQFTYDESIDSGARMSALINEAVSSDKARHVDDDDDQLS